MLSTKKPFSDRLRGQRRKAGLWRDRRGAGAVEFALLAPALLLFIIGIAQLGILFFANAGLKNAVGEGARYATLFPKPDNSLIVNRITATRFGLNPAFLTNPTVTDCTVNGRACVDIQMTYAAPLDFVFFKTPPLTLAERRRVFVQN